MNQRWTSVDSGKSNTDYKHLTLCRDWKEFKCQLILWKYVAWSPEIKVHSLAVYCQRQKKNGKCYGSETEDSQPVFTLIRGQGNTLIIQLQCFKIAASLICW